MARSPKCRPGTASAAVTLAVVLLFGTPAANAAAQQPRQRLGDRRHRQPAARRRRDAATRFAAHRRRPHPAALRRLQHRVVVDRALHGRGRPSRVRQPPAQPRHRRAAHRRQLAGPHALRSGGGEHQPRHHARGRGRRPRHARRRERPRPPAPRPELGHDPRHRARAGRGDAAVGRARARAGLRRAGRPAGVRRRGARRRRHRPRQRARHLLRLRPPPLPRRPRGIPRRRRHRVVADRRPEHERDDRAVAGDRGPDGADALLLGVDGDPRRHRAGDDRTPGVQPLRRARHRPLLSRRTRMHHRRVPLRDDRAPALGGAPGEPRLQHLPPRHAGARARPRLSPAGGQLGRRARRAGRQRRRRRRDLGDRDDVRDGLPAAAGRARRQRRLPDRIGRREPPQRRGQPLLGAPGGQRVLQRDRLRPVAGDGRPDGPAAVLRAAAVLPLRAGHARAAARPDRLRHRRPRGPATEGVAGRGGPFGAGACSSRT